MESLSSSGTVRFGSSKSFNSVKVFSATMMADRSNLGEDVTTWMHEHPDYEIVEITVTQSSDSAFHCLALTVFFNDPSAS